MTAPQIFGIDLGTTYSAIAYVDEFGKPVIVLNEDDEPITASAIYFETPNDPIVGKVAKMHGRANPVNYADMIKPHMGGECDSTGAPIFRWEFHGKEYRAEQLSAIILKKLKTYAEAKLNVPVSDVIITVPAYFNERQRNATEQAGILAGLNVKRIIPEPTAAAVAYATTDADQRTVLVYDLGGGTFDVTVMRVEGKIRVVCVDGDHNLGGRQWDDAIVAYFANQWQNSHGADEDPTADPETRQELLNQAEESKKSLSRLTEVPVAVNHAGKKERVRLSREKFDELTASLLESTLAKTRKVVAEARELGAPRIDLILLVGGSSRMPQVQAALQREFPGIEQKLFDPELAVALGAAIFARDTRIQDAYTEAIAKVFGGDKKLEDLTPDQREAIDGQVTQAIPDIPTVAIDAASARGVTNVSTKSFGLVARNGETMQMEVSFLIERNREVPATKTETFYASCDNQQVAALRIIESSADYGPHQPLPADPGDPSCHELKTIDFELPPGIREGHPIEVTYSLSDDGGRLMVHARDPRSGREVRGEVENVGAIGAADMAAMKRELDTIVCK